MANALSGQAFMAGGVMCADWGAKLDQIEDGTSTTIMLNELRVGINSRDRRGVWALGFPASSVTAAHCYGDAAFPNDRSLNSDDIEDCTALQGTDPTQYDQPFHQRMADDGMGCYGNSEWAPPGLRNNPNGQGEARSRHPSGVHIAFADGSVHYIRNDIANTAWFLMNSRNDGHVYQYDY